MKIALIIPAYNEVNRIEKTLKSLSKVNLPVVVVSDGSKDKTAVKAIRHASHVLEHRVNLGKGAAMKTGAEFAFQNGFDAIIYFDADGQHDVADLEKFTSALKNKVDVVIGSRTYSQDIPIVRYLGNKFASLIVSLLFGIYVSDLLCGYRAITRKAYGAIKWDSVGYGVETEMIIRLSKTKLKWKEVPVKTIYLDKVKGVTLLDAFSVLFQVLLLRLKI